MENTGQGVAQEMMQTQGKDGEMSQEDRQAVTNRARGLFDFASKKDQEDTVMQNIKDMIRDLAESVDKLNKKVFAGEAGQEASQNPLNSPVGVSNPQQQPDPQAELMNKLVGAMGAQQQQQQQNK